MRLAALIVLIVASTCGIRAAQFFVAPNGSPGGNGTIRHPWDLQTALNSPPAVRPGDTFWLRQGTYVGSFISNLNGAPDMPIIVRAYPGEWPVIDRAATGLFPSTFQINGSWAWFWGFEITNSDPTRTINAGGSNPNEGRAQAVTVNNATNVKLINLVVHDNGNGIVDNNGGSDNEIYGCAIYSNGWLAPDRGHGDGIYAQNSIGEKSIVDNIIFSGYNEGINVWGSDQARLIDFRVEGNIVFDSGVLGGYFQHNILVGGNGLCRNPLIANNYSYFSSIPAYGPGQTLNLGYAKGCGNAVVQNNYLASTTLFIANRNLTMSGNTLAGLVEFVGGNTPTEDLAAYGGNTNIPYGVRPRGVRVFVRPNRYEQGRGSIAVFNWDQRSAASVDLSGILTVGAPYEVRDVQDFFAPPIVTGIYDGSPVSVPMGPGPVSSQSAAPDQPRHTTAEFGAFLVVPPGAIPFRK